jgi:hypothetical protein
MELEASNEFGWSNRTLNNNEAALSTMFTLLESEKITAANPLIA